MIEIKNLTKIYGKSSVAALDNVSFNIDKGMFGLLGNNGAGKTTFMNILSTILDKNSGEVSIEGIKLEDKNFPMIRSIIGYMPQETAVYPNFTPVEALDYYGILNRLSSKERKKRINEILEYTNLTSHKNKKFKSLSGGMKRRLSLGISIINNPKILIVDEPTTGVDPSERIRMRNLLLDLSETKTVILSTHIIEDISYTCENLAVLSLGKLKYCGNITHMVSKAKNLIWEMKINNFDDLKEINKNNLVLSAQNINDYRMVKIASKQKPYKEAVLVNPTLEDSYIVLERLA